MRVRFLSRCRPAITAEEADRAMEILRFLGITRLAYEETRSLSYGQKKLMDFAALLMSDPKIILLDEPAGGVNPSLLAEIVAHLRKLHEGGLSVLILAHNMEMVMILPSKAMGIAACTVIVYGTTEVVQAC